MDTLAILDVFLFDGFRFEPRGGGLFRRGETGAYVPMPVGARALEILGILVRRSGELVTRDELRRGVARNRRREQQSAGAGRGASPRAR